MNGLTFDFGSLPGPAHYSTFADPAMHSDPIGRLPRGSSGPAGPRLDADLFEGLAMLVLMAPLALLLWLPPHLEPLVALGIPWAFMVILIVRLVRFRLHAPTAWMRHLERHRGPFEVRWDHLDGDTTNPVFMSIELPPARPGDGRRFDVDDVTHRKAARVLYTARVRDGLALEGERTMTVLYGVLGRHRGAKAARVQDWVMVARWLTGMADPRGAWLAAMAWAEQSRWQRARAALDQIEADPALLVCLAASPVPAVQIALAIHQGRLDQVPLPDPAHADRRSTLELIEARLDLGENRVDDWVADPAFAPLLVHFESHRLEPRHWLALVGHADLSVAGPAAAMALEMPAPTPRVAARALLEHPAIPTLTDLYYRDYIVRVVDRCLEQLSRVGDVSDLPRMALWESVCGDQGLGRLYGDILAERLAAEGEA